MNSLAGNVFAGSDRTLAHAVRSMEVTTPLIIVSPDESRGTWAFSKEFCWPSRTKGIIGRDLKFTGYVHHYKILTKYFWPHFEKQDGCHRRFFSAMKSAYISLTIGPRGLQCETNL